MAWRRRRSLCGSRRAAVASAPWCLMRSSGRTAAVTVSGSSHAAVVELAEHAAGAVQGGAALVRASGCISVSLISSAVGGVAAQGGGGLLFGRLLAFAIGPPISRRTAAAARSFGSAGSSRGRVRADPGCRNRWGLMSAIACSTSGVSSLILCANLFRVFVDGVGWEQEASADELAVEVCGPALDFAGMPPEQLSGEPRSDPCFRLCCAGLFLVSRARHLAAGRRLFRGPGDR